MKNLLIIGAGAIGREVSLIVQQINRLDPTWNLIGFIDDNYENWGKVINGYTVIGGVDNLEFFSEDHYVIIAISNYKEKKKIVDRLNGKFKFATIVHPNIWIHNFMTLGEGSIVYDGVVITSNVEIGKHVIISPKCGIGHDTKIKDYVSLLWNVNIIGNSIIEDGVILKDNTTIARDINVSRDSESDEKITYEGNDKSSMKKIVIIGAGGFGREVAWLIENINNNNSEWDILGFIDEDESKRGQAINSYPILGGFEYFRDNTEEIYYVCAIGNAKLRKYIIEQKCSIYNIKAATLIDPNIIIDESNIIGEGSIICAGTILTTNISIGQHVIVNLSCTLGHDDIIDDYVTIYPNANISGSCKIEKCVEVGTGSEIIQGKIINENSIIGAGSVVIRDIEANKTVAGIPAKVIKKG